MTDTAAGACTWHGKCMWLYGVLGSEPPPENGWESVPGVAGEQVRAIQEEGLVALAGAVPESEFGQPAIRRNLERLDWLSAVAGAHDAVVRSAMDGTAVIPVRLVTLFSDEAAIRALLRSRRADFEQTLSHLRGRTEWGVKVFGEPQPDAQPDAQTDAQPDAQPGTERAPQPAGATASGPGASYLLRRQAARTQRQRTLRAAADLGDRLHARLVALAVAGRRNNLSAAAAAGSGQLVLNGTYLVDDRRFETFREAVAAEDGHDAVRVELTGPWPPYSFASVPGLTRDG